jgi:hypothetical protein
MMIVQECRELYEGLRGSPVIELARIEECLLKHPLFRSAEFDEMKVEYMNEEHKDDYWGLSLRRYLQATDRDGKAIEKWGLRGYIYINVRDAESDDKLLQIAAHEAAHLLDGSEALMLELHDYLKKNLGGE